MSLVLYHHPFPRAAGTLWILEEVGVPYELRWVDIMAGEQKKPEVTKHNPMGKLPTLVDGDVVVTEAAAAAGVPNGLHNASHFEPPQRSFAARDLTGGPRNSHVFRSHGLIHRPV